MTSDDLKKYNEQLQHKNRNIEKYSTYAYGKNHGIVSADEVSKPDNRIPIPLGKSAVTDIVGYAGRPGEIKTSYKNTADEQDDITTILELFDEHNKEGIENSELLTASLSVGIAWELWWTSDELELSNGILTPEYKIVPNNEILPIWTDSLKPKLEKAIRFWCAGTGKDKKEYADIYMPLKWERWEFVKDNWQQVKPVDEDGNPISREHPYNRVPVIPFRTGINDEPVFLAQIPIIDSLDAIVSKTQNEVDRYNALISLFPNTVSKEFIDKLIEAAKPYIDGLGQYDPGQWPKYLEKNLSGVNEFYQGQADRLERLFHKTIKVPDMTDKEFAGDQSGVAIAYKLIGFEFLVSEIEIYFRLGLEERYEFYADILDLSTIKFDREEYKQEITWNRNLPVDAEMKLRIAAMLQGLGYDMSIINKVIPESIVSMTEEELEKMEAERIEGRGELDALSIEGTGTTEEAVEVAKLSGIQIQSANTIIQQVSDGVLTREAGINQLMVFLGLTKEQAAKVMGKQ